MLGSLANTDVHGRLKGAAFAEFVRWYATKHGAAVLAERVAVLPATLQLELGIDRDGATLGILASRWYDCRAIGVLLDAMVDGAAEPEYRRLADEAANAVMHATLHGMYRLLFQWLATPQRYARHCDRLWRSYHDTGTMRIEHDGPTRAICTISSWSGHHAFLCAICRASAEVIYREMGCGGVHTERVCCVGEGADVCRFVTRWD